MTKSKWDFRMQGDRSAEIYIYEEIGEMWGLSARDFASELESLGDVDSLSIRINSMGGSVFDGFTIHSLLKNHPARVTVNVDGIAASIASVIAMAGDEIRIAENGFLMIHEPWTISLGTARDLRNEADVLDKLQSQAVATYANRTGLGADEVTAMMDGIETWLNASDAIEKGFADSMTEPSKAAALVIDRTRFPNAPAALKHRDTEGEAGEKIAQARAEREAEAVAIRMRLLDIAEDAA